MSYLLYADYRASEQSKSEANAKAKGTTKNSRKTLSYQSSSKNLFRFSTSATSSSVENCPLMTSISCFMASSPQSTSSRPPTTTGKRDGFTYKQPSTPSLPPGLYPCLCQHKISSHLTGALKHVQCLQCLNSTQNILWYLYPFIRSWKMVEMD